MSNLLKSPRFAGTNVLVFALFSAAGCSSTFQGIRVRGESPTIDEAFRRLSFAVTVDGYEITKIDPGKFTLETDWRPLKDQEKSVEDRKLMRDTLASHLTIRLERRGRMYDVFITPLLHHSGSTVELVPDVSHPLVQKWRRIAGDLIRKEIKEGD